MLQLAACFSAGCILDYTFLGCEKKTFSQRVNLISDLNGRNPFWRAVHTRGLLEQLSVLPCRQFLCTELLSCTQCQGLHARPWLPAKKLTRFLHAEAKPWVDVPHGYILGGGGMPASSHGGSLAEGYFSSASGCTVQLALGVGVKQQGGGCFVWCAGFSAMGNASPAQLA